MVASVVGQKIKVWGPLELVSAQVLEPEMRMLVRLVLVPQHAMCPEDARDRNMV